MLSIQDVGLSILGDSPKNFYILGGDEYGIKEKYIEILESKVGECIESESVMGVVDLMSKHHIVPLPPRVYVVRYDKVFVSKANKDIASKILSLDIVGTLVLIYEDTKDLTKLDKLFPDNTATISRIDNKHMIKYLKSDFPDLNAKTIEYAAKYASNYYQAKNICRCLYAIQDKMMLSEKQIVALFDIKLSYSNDDLQIAIASKNFNAFSYIVDNYDGDLNGVIYQILSVMIELEKCQSGSYVKSQLKKYAKDWTSADIYWMFNHTYEAIKLLRSGYDADVRDILIYLGSLMMFKNIPNLQVMR